MATSGQGIWSPLGEGSVSDYKHAAQIFRTNDYARAPKTKYLFFVNIKINPQARAIGVDSDPNAQGKNELSYLVKTTDLPKFDIEMQDLNQYNRKVLIQRQIKYNPITIKFHDDNQGTLRNFWKSYYQFYFADGRYDESVFAADDKYTKKENAASRSRWGFDTGTQTPFLTSIEIFSMYHGKAQKVVLHNPLISGFAHDTHDYADNAGLLEASMTIQYTGVTYYDNVNVKTAIPGFGLNSPETYDVDLSDLTAQKGLQVDPKTGELYDPDLEQEVNADVAQNMFAQQRLAYNYNPPATNFITNKQLSVMLQNSSRVPVNSYFLFPEIDTARVVHSDYGVVELQSSVSTSGGITIATPASVIQNYPIGSWQSSLFNKGYSSNQISSAQKFLATTTATSNVAGIAEQYIQSSNMQKPIGNNLPTFGQNTVNSTNINFSNPTAATQPVYNSQDWQYDLAAKGYTNAEISVAARFLATVKIAPGTNLSKLAENYILNFKTTRTGPTVGTSTGTTATQTRDELVGPSYSLSDTSLINSGYSKL